MPEGSLSLHIKDTKDLPAQRHLKYHYWAWTCPLAQLEPIPTEQRLNAGTVSSMRDLK